MSPVQIIERMTGVNRANRTLIIHTGNYSYRMIRSLLALAFCLIIAIGCRQGTTHIVYGADNKPHVVGATVFPRSGETRTVNAAGRSITYKVPGDTSVTFATAEGDSIRQRGGIINFHPRHGPAGKEQVFVQVSISERDPKPAKPVRLEHHQQNLANGTWTEESAYSVQSNSLIALTYVRKLSSDSDLRITTWLGPMWLKHQPPDQQLVAQMRTLCREFAANLLFGN